MTDYPLLKDLGDTVKYRDIHIQAQNLALNDVQFSLDRFISIFTDEKKLVAAAYYANVLEPAFREYCMVTHREHEDLDAVDQCSSDEEGSISLEPPYRRPACMTVWTPSQRLLCRQFVRTANPYWTGGKRFMCVDKLAEHITTNGLVVKDLDLSECYLTDADIEHIVKAAAACEQLEVLNLSDNHLQVPGMEKLLPTLPPAVRVVVTGNPGASYVHQSLSLKDYAGRLVWLPYDAIDRFEWRVPFGDADGTVEQLHVSHYEDPRSALMFVRFVDRFVVIAQLADARILIFTSLHHSRPELRLLYGHVVTVSGVLQVFEQV